MTVRIIQGDCLDVLKTLADQSVHCCVTSPPYWGLRDYGVEGQLGLESTPAEYVEKMVAVFREVRRVLRDDGTLWLNLGDSYANTGGASSAWSTATEQAKKRVGNADLPKKELGGLKPKDLVGIPWRVAFALQADGWYLRQDIIWAKPNPMPESVRDRCTKAHEYIFLLSKSDRYHFDADAIAEPAVKAGLVLHGEGTGAKDRENVTDTNDRRTRIGLSQKTEPQPETRNKRSVWTVATQTFKEAHFATFPPALIEPCILAGCPVGGTVLDPFGGAGTTGLVADRLQRSAILIELNPEYAAMAEKRIHADGPLFSEVTS